MPGVFDLAGPVSACNSAPTSVAFPPNRQRRHPDFPSFRGSMSGRTKARTGNNADVSFVPPKIPDGAFSAVRFQGRPIRGSLPVDHITSVVPSLPPSFVHIAFCVKPSLCVEENAVALHTTVQRPLSLYPRGPRSGRVLLPRPSSLNRPHAPHSPAHSDFASSTNTKCPHWVSPYNTSATSQWFRAFTVRSFSACRPLRPRGVHWVHALSSSPMALALRRRGTSSALPGTPVIRFRRGMHLAASLRFAFATAC